jgi:hypothetical protein
MSWSHERSVEMENWWLMMRQRLEAKRRQPSALARPMAARQAAVSLVMRRSQYAPIWWPARSDLTQMMP